MKVTFAHKDWKSLEEGAVTKTVFFGVQKIWFDPTEGIISLLLQSGWVYEHELERSWEYSITDNEEDVSAFATEVSGNPRGYFRS
jgi:hypothetical protein